MIVDNFDILFYNLNEAREFQILRLLFYYFGFKPLCGVVKYVFCFAALMQQIYEDWREKNVQVCVKKTAYADSGHYRRDVHCVFHLNLSPGDPAAIILGDQASAEALAMEEGGAGTSTTLCWSVTDII